MDKILDILKLKKLNKFLVLNYSIIWKHQIPFLLIFSLFYSVFLFFIPLDFVIQPFGMLFLIFLMTIFIIFLTKMDLLFIKVKLLGLKEYFLHLFIVLLFIIPFFISIQSGEYFWNTNKKIYTDNYHAYNFEFQNKKCVYKINKERTRDLDKAEKNFINTIIKNFSEKNITTVSEKDFEEVISKYKKLSFLSTYKNNFEIWIILLLIIPFLIIIAIYGVSSDLIMPFLLLILMPPEVIYFLIYEKIINIDFILVYLNQINIYISTIILFLATIFIHLYRVIINYYMIFFILFGLGLYFFVFTFYMNLTILQAGLLVVLNMLFIVSSLKDRLIILNARPKK